MKLTQQMNSVNLSMIKKRSKVTSFSKVRQKKKILDNIYTEFLIAQESGDYKRAGELAGRYLKFD